MTAEIVIMNRGAVALAADSAVTIGDGSKVYNTVNKVFTLSKYHPVGIMIYGNADYMTIPWETVIKLYREQLGRRSFPTVVAYTRDFFRFLEGEFTISLQDEKDRVGQLWFEYFEQLSDQLHRILVEAANQQPLKQSDVSGLFLALVKQRVGELRNRSTLDSFSDVTLSSIQNRFAEQYRAARDECLGNRGRKITPAIDRALQDYAALVIVKEEFELGISGIVITGFGDDEIFPALCHTDCAGYFLGRLKIRAPSKTHVTSERDKHVQVIAYAQREMVAQFMEGIDPGYSEYIREGVTQLVQNLAGELVDKYSSGRGASKTKQAAAAKRAAVKMIEEFERKAERFRYVRYVGPTLSVMSLLPKEELAELAGALVNITSLKRKFAFEAETVGGPVDVAVISKGDGFIWIRRKHYFRPELNQAFLKNYLPSEGK